MIARTPVTLQPPRDKDSSVDPLARLFLRWHRDGDVEALGLVFDRLAPRLLGLALHLCGNPADAEDALQGAFVLAMRRASAFDPARRLEPWLAGLLTNAARSARRSARRRRSGALDDAVSGGRRWCGVFEVHADLGDPQTIAVESAR